MYIKTEVHADFKFMLISHKLLTLKKILKLKYQTKVRLSKIK